MARGDALSFGPKGDPRTRVNVDGKPSLSNAAKNPYRGGSKKLPNNCGKKTCPANSVILRMFYYFRNTETSKQRATEYDPVKKRQYRKKWKNENRGAVNADTAARKQHIAQATPKWLTEEQKAETVMIYKVAAEQTLITGIAHHVDHIVPLRGSNVSGLHVAWNLRVVTAEENYQKNNKFSDDT
jgi:5-methylcytosine-specific restriction endonuclease McrA